ncbi:MAG: alpha/beta hydrolase [Chrysiogenales bacterium]|nr:MAG: alpha/beta hydrolase [Chrysiogenales bacterium]
MNDYSQYDHPDLLAFLFHPRPEESSSLLGDSVRELLIPIDRDVSIGGKIFIAGNKSPSILFFHGNGEIVEDYDDLGPLFISMNINFIPVDYRGYGRSGGIPTVSSMMSDCHTIFSYMRSWFSDNGFTGVLLVMGRSLGSAPALELASRHPGMIRGLVIESGFTRALPLLRRLGINPERYGIEEDGGFGNLYKIRMYNGPTLIIHAERDHIIPYSDGLSLYEASVSGEKKILTIPHADHNTIFMHGIKEYMASIKNLTDVSAS